MGWPLKLQGRLVTESQVNDIRELLEDHPSWNRSRLSRELCKRWQWQRPDGQMKDMACRELLRKLESRTLIKLPPRHRLGPGRPPEIEVIEVDQSPIACTLSEIKPVTIVNARHRKAHERAFNALLNQHHYLSYQRPVGQNMKYLILGGNGRILGCLLFGAAAWKTAARDQWIGWSTIAREKNLGLLCNNTRFLIFDWVRVPHLASYALAACLRRLPRDWVVRYGTDIVMVETFVDTTRYKAANWIRVGQTTGRSRQDRDRDIQVPIKDVFVYPLRRNTQKILLA